MGAVMLALCLIVVIGGYEYALNDCAADEGGPVWHEVAPGMLPAVGDCSECIPPEWERERVLFRPLPCGHE